jgi:predicted ATPase
MSIYRFAQAELRPQARQLIVRGESVKIGGRAFDLLLALVERRDRVVSKNELIELVWPDVVVEENNLQVQIVALRKLLGTQAIVTVPGRGYRFTPTLDDVAEATRAAEPVISDAPAMERHGKEAPHARAPLRLQALPLYGRDADLANVQTLLSERNLVTIVGPPGIGKTRLAQALARQMRVQFAGGVFVAELAPLADAALVPAAVAHALGLTLSPHRPPLEDLVEQLRNVPGDTLVLLDNCEHVLAQAGATAAALIAASPAASTAASPAAFPAASPAAFPAVSPAAAPTASAAAAPAASPAATPAPSPAVRVLATSQEPLKAAGEQVYRLSALAIPERADDAHALHYGAIELFVTRVREADPRFAVTPRAVESIVEICRRLDGIALAIELAAARVPLLGVEGVRAHLNERFRLLGAGTRDAPSRHQTLRAAFDWSYGLLSEPERTVFDRLGVFAGSFSLAAAQQVAAHGDIDEWAVLDHLGALVDKSLVLAEGGDVPRYRLLESWRAWARERLSARGESDAVLHRHAEAMCRSCEAAIEQREAGVSLETAYAPLEGDLDNLRTALAWCAGRAQEKTLALALCAYSRPLWSYHGAYAEGLAWYRRLGPLLASGGKQAAASSALPPLVEARYWYGLAHVGIFVAPPRELAAAATKAATLFESAGRPAWVARSLGLAAQAHAFIGDSAQAEQLLKQAAAFKDPALPDDFLTFCGGFCDLFAGRLAQARSTLQQTAAYAEQHDELNNAVYDLALVAMIDYAEGNAAAAATLSQQLVERRKTAPRLKDFSPFLWAVLPAALTELGQLDAAEQAFREGLPIVRRAYGAASVCIDHLALYLIRRGRLEDAARLSGYSESYYSGDRELRFPDARRSREVAHAILRERLPRQIESLQREGRRLSDDAACALALA